MRTVDLIFRPLERPWLEALRKVDRYGEGYATKASAKRAWQRVVSATASGVVREQE